MLYFIAVVVGLLVLRLFLFKGPYANPSEPVDGVLDMHCHTAGFGAGGSGARVSRTLRESWKFKIYLRIFGTTEAEVEEKGDARVMEIIADEIRGAKLVDDVVILAMDVPYDEEGNLDEEAIEVYVPNRFVGVEVKRHKALHFGASVHPDRKDALEELEWSKENGAVLVK